MGNVIVVEYEKEIKVSESEEIGNQLTSIVAKDEDATEQNRFISFELLDSNSPFALNQHGDNTVSLILKDKLDFEEKALYYVNIKAFNKQANERIEQTEAIIQVKISVIDENESPIHQNPEIIFKEGDESGTPAVNVYLPLAIDPDFGGIDDIEYKIEQDSEKYFKISKSGILSVSST